MPKYIVLDTHIKKDRKMYGPGQEIELTEEEAIGKRLSPVEVKKIEIPVVNENVYLVNETENQKVNKVNKVNKESKK